MPQRKQWEDMNKSEKATGLIILAVVAVIVIAIIASIIGSPKDNVNTPKQSTTNTVEKTPEPKKVSVVDKVNKALDGLDKDTKTIITSTSLGGYQGEITGVKADGNDGVVVDVSTYFKKTDESKDGGKNIARKIFSMLCLDIPELSNLYVTSTSSGLDSQSIYRSDIPACNQ